jgi:hypothetical protein
VTQQEQDASPYFHDIICCGPLLVVTPPKREEGISGSGKSYCPLHNVMVWSQCGWQIGYHQSEDSRALIETELVNV